MKYYLLLKILRKFDISQKKKFSNIFHFIFTGISSIPVNFCIVCQKENFRKVLKNFAFYKKKKILNSFFFPNKKKIKELYFIRNSKLEVLLTNSFLFFNSILKNFIYFSLSRSKSFDCSFLLQLGWVCQYDSLPTVAQSIFFIGAIFGGLIFGWIADQYGRIPALIGANMMGFLAGVATAFTNTFWQFALCRFFVGFAFDNCFTMMYILGNYFLIFVLSFQIIRSVSCEFILENFCIIKK